MQAKFLTENIFIINDGDERGFTTGGAVSESGTILIGCDDRLTPDIISGLGLPGVCAILCCDHRRSSNAGILNFSGVAKYAGESACELLARPELWWNNPENRWHLYAVTNDDDKLARGALNLNKVADGQQIIIGGVKISALATPGDTEGSMSYMLGNIVFCGGLLYKGGKLPYLYRLTQAAPEHGDYHGYLRALPVWQTSLDTIARADIAVPYLGGVIYDLRADIAAFKQNIGEYYQKYADISSMNYYFGGWLEPGVKVMDWAQEKDLPEYIKYIGDQCYIICSKSGGAVAIDCGGADMTDKLLGMIGQGELKSVDALYITHYHDDHVDGCDYFRANFDCPIYADKIQADILANPSAYRLPCISDVSVDVTPLDDGHSWQWQEFELTSLEFPGQTLYHDALLLKNLDSGELILFAGDSFTPSGIDDYCAYNRNLMLPGEGFFKCISILREHNPDYIINQHVMRAFSFTRENLDYMEQNLTERLDILAKLSPWDDINHALDAHFIMAHPYEQDGDDNAEIKLSGGDSGEYIRYEVVPPEQKSGKNIYGVRVYVGGAYLGQKSCYIVNR